MLNRNLSGFSYLVVFISTLLCWKRLPVLPAFLFVKNNAV